MRTERNFGRPHAEPHLKASRRGQDKRGRRRSDAIPPNELSWEKVDQIWQNVATCRHLKQNNYDRIQELKDVVFDNNSFSIDVKIQNNI